VLNSECIANILKISISIGFPKESTNKTFITCTVADV
jgi:hypothetical protein